MKKSTKIIIAVSVSVMALLAGFLFIFQKNSPSPASPGTLLPGGSVGFSIPPEGAPKMSVRIEEKTGEPITTEKKVEVNNVYNNPVATIPYNNYTGVLFKAADDYSISFYPDGEQFSIIINNSELNMAREKAEAGLLEALGISKEEACQLNVSLRTTIQVNRENAGREFGLSFCPDGKPFK